MHLRQQQRFIYLLGTSAKSKISTCQKSRKDVEKQKEKKKRREIDKQEKKIPKVKHDIKIQTLLKTQAQRIIGTISDLKGSALARTAWETSAKFRTALDITCDGKD